MAWPDMPGRRTPPPPIKSKNQAPTGAFFFVPSKVPSKAEALPGGLFWPVLACMQVRPLHHSSTRWQGVIPGWCFSIPSQGRRFGSKNGTPVRFRAIRAHRRDTAARHQGVYSLHRSRRPAWWASGVGAVEHQNATNPGGDHGAGSPPGHFVTFATPKPLNHAGSRRVLLTTMKRRKKVEGRALGAPWPVGVGASQYLGFLPTRQPGSLKDGGSGCCGCCQIGRASCRERV